MTDTSSTPLGSTPLGSTPSEPVAQISFQDVVAEIVAEAKRRRDSGEYSAADLERLDSEFDRFAPLTYRRTGIDGAIRAVESASFINVDVPTDASRRPFAIVKQTVKKSTAWYHLHVARQVTTLGIQVTRPLRMLASELDDLRGRVAQLETQTGPYGELRAELAHHEFGPDNVSATDLYRALEGTTGQIMAHGIEPSTVEALIERGIDAHLVAQLDTDSDGSDGPGSADVRLAEVGAYLHGVADGVLGAIVLAGPAINSRTVDSRLRLVTEAIRTLKPGGRLVIVGKHRLGWDAALGPVAADLTPGHPLSTPTWLALLGSLGARTTRDLSTDDRVIVTGSAS